MGKSIVVVLSGGLDSTVALFRTRYEYPHYDLRTISFNYGQRHNKELTFAKRQSKLCGAVEHQEVDLTSIIPLFEQSGSSLVTDTEVPDGHYAEESMKATVVPNRNMIMASIAAGYAVSIGARLITLGVHGGDHFIYPDCRPEFFDALKRTIALGNEGFIADNFEIYTPYINLTKNDIASDAFRFDVDITNTWSCYKGGQIHCGTCGTCVERQEAIASTGQEDPTIYLISDYWKEKIQERTLETFKD